MEFGRVGRKCKGHWVNGVENPIRTKQPTPTTQEKPNHTRWRGRKVEKIKRGKERGKHCEDRNDWA